MIDISIIVPIYNGEKYIDKCIEMILNQTLKNFELIIIDDGSTDKSAQICSEYADKDNRIKLITKKNQGTWAARNRGIDESLGKYIVFLDCDDWYENNLLAEMYENIEDNDVDLVISGQTDIMVNSNAKVIKKVKVLPEKHFFLTREEILDNFIKLRKESIGDVLWNKIYKAEIIKKNNLKFEDYKRGEDTIFNANYYQHIDKCIVIDKSFYNYRVENSNPVWLKYSENYFNIVLIENKTVIDKLKEWGRYDISARKYQSTHFIYRIIEYFFWIVYTKNHLNIKEKSSKVLNIITDQQVKKYLDDADVIGIFSRLIIKFMKSKNVFLILLLTKVKLIQLRWRGLSER